MKKWTMVKKQLYKAVGEEYIDHPVDVLELYKHRPFFARLGNDNNLSSLKEAFVDLESKVFVFTLYVIKEKAIVIVR